MSTKLKSISIEDMTITLYVEGIAYRVTTIHDRFETTRIFVDYREASNYFESAATGN